MKLKKLFAVFLVANTFHCAYGSIQRCSVWVLEKYYCDFPVYNPALMRTPSRSARMKQINSQTFKVYNVDGEGELPGHGFTSPRKIVSDAWKLAVFNLSFESCAFDIILSGCNVAILNFTYVKNL